MSLTTADGWALLVFPGVTRATTGPDADWVQAVAGCYARNLNVVVRIGPPWGRYEGQYCQALGLVAGFYQPLVSGRPVDLLPVWWKGQVS